MTNKGNTARVYSYVLRTWTKLRKHRKGVLLCPEDMDKIKEKRTKKWQNQ